MHVSQRNIIKKLYSDFSEANWINRENLRTVLEMGRHIPFGKEHRFGKLRTVEAFREEVPLSDHSDYIKRPFGDFIPFPARYTVSSAGSMGKQNIFPITLESLRRYSSYSYDMPYTLTDVDWGTHLHTSIFIDSPSFTRGSLFDIYFAFLWYDGRLDFSSFAGGRELLFSDSVDDVPYVKSWLALATANLASIQSVHFYDILLLFRYIEENWRTILSDMRRRDVSAQLCDEVKERLLELCPDEEWLNRIEGILSEGFSEPVAPKIWDNLRFVSGIGGTDYDFQERALDRYIGSIPVFHFAYALPECMIGVPLDFNKREYALLPRSAYYEFIPAEGGDVLNMDEIQEGGLYEIVVTTFSGLYRYRTGSIIKVLSFFCQTPIFEVCEQRGYTMNIAGERFDEATVSAALSRMAKASGKTPKDFALGIDESVIPCRYVLFAEGETGDAELFDRLLRELSADYDHVRSRSMIAPPVICTVEKGEIAKSLSLSGSENSHTKPRVFSDREQTEYLLKRTMNNGIK